MSDTGPLQEGQRFAGCIVARVLGRGTQSIVYAAFDDRLHAWRALKLLPPPNETGTDTDPRQQAEARDRLRQELAAVARLRHPGIVRIHGAGLTRGLPWLLMDLLPGTDLTRYTQPLRRLPPPVIAGIGARIAEALACAHAAGIVHRDLKPANVVLDWASDSVVLTDFGLARAADAARTRTGLVLGTPAYMAPELLAGQAPSPASDLYALGVLLFQLLAARLPFEGSGLGDLLRAVASTPAPDLLPLVPPPHDPVLPPLAVVVRSLLAKDPAQRPAGAAAVASMLQALLPPPAAPEAAGTMSRG